MTILFVTEYYHPYIGGSEKLFLQLASTLVDKGHRVIVVTSRFDKKSPIQEMYKGIEIHRVRCFGRFDFTFLSIFKILKWAKQADIIQTTTYNAALPAWLASRITHKKIVLTFHEVWNELWWQLPFLSKSQRLIFYLYEQLILKLSFDKIVAVSNYTQCCLVKAGIENSKIDRIYNGLNYHHFNKKWQPPKSHFQVTYFGRLGVSKGLDLLIVAFSQFLKKYPKAQLQLIIPKQPDGMYRSILALLEEYDLLSNVIFQHHLPKEELTTCILHSSAVIVPSYSEGFCFTAAETVALGVPIIASNRGALPEVVSGKYLLIERQEVSSVCLALELAYFEKWKERPIKHFELKKTVSEYLKLYQELRNEN